MVWLVLHPGLIEPDDDLGCIEAELAAELHEGDAALGDKAAQVADAGSELERELVDSEESGERGVGHGRGHLPVRGSITYWRLWPSCRAHRRS